MSSTENVLGKRWAIVDNCQRVVCLAKQRQNAWNLSVNFHEEPQEALEAKGYRVVRVKLVEIKDESEKD